MASKEYVSAGSKKKQEQSKKKLLWRNCIGDKKGFMNNVERKEN